MERFVLGIQLRSRIYLACLLLIALGSPSRAAETVDSQSPNTARSTLRLPVPNPLDIDRSRELPSALVPVLRQAFKDYQYVRQSIRDYTCVVVRRERVEGRLRPHEFIQAKVRHRQFQNGQLVVPFSVYLRFLRPESVAGREVLYVEGKHDGNLLARRGGKRFAFMTAEIHPESDVAMQGNRYPITEFGIENLLRRLIESAQTEANRDVQVQYLEDARINDRATFGVVVTHPQQTEEATFYLARILSDKEMKVPVHFEAYAWPREEGGEPLLLEKYTYTQLQLNVGLTDWDFDEDNPDYQVK